MFRSPTAAALACLISFAGLSPSLAAPECPVPARGGPAADSAAATIGGQKITVAEVDARIAGELCKARVELAQKEAELRQQSTEQLIAEKLLEAEAKARGLAGVEALIAAEVVEPVSAPPDAELKAFYEANKARMGGASYDDMAPRIAEHLTGEARQARFEALVTGLRARSGVKLTLEPFRMKVEAKGPAKGPADAPVTIVSFADYECPYCAKAAASVAEAAAKFPGKVRLVFRDFPLDFHANAVPAAIAARCAGAQGKYYAMHDLLFADQQSLDPATFKAHAATLKLDAAKFDACFADPAHMAAINADHEAGKALGVEGTPAFFFNGIPLSGAQPAAAYEALIQAELDRARK